jgi:hypothetical protein
VTIGSAPVARWREVKIAQQASAVTVSPCSWAATKASRREAVEREAREAMVVTP